MSNFELLSLEAAAAHIHMAATELKHVAQRGEIESVLRGEDFFFEHRMLDEWAQRRMVALSEKQLTGEHKLAMRERRAAHTPDCRVSDLIVPEAVFDGVEAKNRAGVLRDLTELAESTGLVYDKDALFHGLMDREEAASTAMAGGVAFPHARFHDPYLVSETFVALARTRRPIFFGGPEGEGTDVFFLICCTDHALHLHVLARLCLLARDTDLLAALRAAPDAAAMHAAFAAAEDAWLLKNKAI